MGIKNKVSVIVTLLFGVFFAGAATLFLKLGEADIRHSVATQQAALVKTLAHGFDQQVSARHKVLITIAEKLSPELLDDPARLQAFVHEQIALSTLFTNILVYGADGTVLAAYPSPEKYVGSKRLVNQEYVVHTLESHEPYISKVFVSPISSEPLIVMTAPVLDKNGKLLAILGGSQYILRDNLFAGFTETRIGNTGSMVLVTRERVIIAHPDKTRVMEQLAPGANKAVEKALTAASFVGETVSSRGVPDLIAIETMQTTGWLAAAVLPLAEAYEPITAMRNQAIQVMVGLLLILPTLVWLSMSLLSRPLIALRDRIREMAAAPQANNLMALNRNDEIGELAHAFDRLTQARVEAAAERLKLLERLVTVQEQERLRIARELHDQMGQNVTGLSLGLKSLEPVVQDDRGRQTLHWLETLTAQTGRDLHRTAWELRPTSLDDVGLLRALETYVGDWAERFGITIDLHAHNVDGIRFPTQVETTAYRVVQEAMTNVLKHAGASTVSLVLERHGDCLQIIVEDDGKGFDSAASAGAGRLGLAGMRERLAIVGGTLTVDSVVGGGTALYFRIPLPPSGGGAKGAP
ncbi:MAG: ATP-binding protein [Stellaceae bacterium]